MAQCIIQGIPINFPFEPYDVQKAYMEKVITCLRDGSNGVLESPTGTGKTLSLLCASLAWVSFRKAEIKSQLAVKKSGGASQSQEAPNVVGKANSWGVPKVIYASRTHSQLSQAMQELKRSSYSFMRAVVLGSRDQLCIHPEVMKEQGNSNKVQMCKMYVEARKCSFQLRVESKKDHPDFRGPSVMDIEDLVKVGRGLKMCPYFASKELVDEADITFMPYNYILDPKARKANKIDLNNTIVILDEAHNIEKICEESASVQIKSSDIALAIDDVTHIMKAMEDNSDFNTDEPQDFTINDLVLLKEMLLDLEKEIDAITVENKVEGKTFPANFIFELLEMANFSFSTVTMVTNLLEKLLQFLAVQNQNQNTAFRKGGSFQVLSDLLNVVFVQKEDIMDKIHRSFKVHVQIEEPTKRFTRAGAQKDGWLSKSTAAAEKNVKAGKIINYWCFNPGFGMEQLLNTQVRSVILTSGTLAPLKPLIAELAIPIAQSLENPHIVNSSQVFVKIIGAGPDREQLISNFTNRDNPKYISSLGQTILNVARIVPDGLLVFFPSYPLLNQCVGVWQASGLWTDISRHKPIFVEPRDKESFVSTMEEFYQCIRDLKGACFMAVCRGKVSEGLDFADRNGRAVIITGLPFPPLKDPKVILKKRYLEDNRTQENELLTGQAWYSLDATRAVNQAIGRVIRHSSDYGAILLCDSRFQQPNQVQQLSKWIRQYLGNAPKISTFGPIIKELREFFKNAEKITPQSQTRSLQALGEYTSKDLEFKAKAVKTEKSANDFADPRKILNAIGSQTTQNKIKMENSTTHTNINDAWSPLDYVQQGLEKKPSDLDFMSRLDGRAATIDFNSGNSCHISSNQVTIHKRERSSPTAINSNMTTMQDSLETKKKKFKLVANTNATEPISHKDHNSSKPLENEAPEDRRDFLRVVRSALSPDGYSSFCSALTSYRSEENFDRIMNVLLNLFNTPNLHYLLKAMRRFIRSDDKIKFDEIIASLYK